MLYVIERIVQLIVGGYRDILKRRRNKPNNKLRCPYEKRSVEELAVPNRVLRATEYCYWLCSTLDTKSCMAIPLMNEPVTKCQGYFAYYRITQNFDSGKVWRNLTNRACQKVWRAKLWQIDCSLHRKSINREKIGRENFDESLAIHQIRQISSDFSTVKVLRYTVTFTLFCS